MFEANLVVNNKTGLHARPASDLVQFCQQFKSEILIFTEEEEINCKSIISVLSGGVQQGTPIRLQAEGPDEEVAGGAVANLIASLTD